MDDHQFFMRTELLYFGFKLEHINKAIYACKNIKKCIEYIERLEQEEKDRLKQVEPIDLMRPQFVNNYYSILSRKINELIDKVNSLSKE